MIGFPNSACGCSENETKSFVLYFNVVELYLSFDNLQVFPLSFKESIEYAFLICLNFQEP